MYVKACLQWSHTVYCDIMNDSLMNTVSENMSKLVWSKSYLTLAFYKVRQKEVGSCRNAAGHDSNIIRKTQGNPKSQATIFIIIEKTTKKEKQCKCKRKKKLLLKAPNPNITGNCKQSESVATRWYQWPLRHAAVCSLRWRVRDWKSGQEVRNAK